MMRERLMLSVDFSTLPAYSCYMCELNSTRSTPSLYCVSAVNVSIDTSLAVNLVMIGTGNASFPLHQNPMQYTFTLPPAGGIYPLAQMGVDLGRTDCASPLSLIVMPFVTVAGQPIDMLAMVAGNDNLQCSDTLPLFETLKCSTIGNRYSVITLETPNCITHNVVAPSSYDPPRGHSPLYWAIQYLTPSVSIHNGGGEGRLCGRPWSFWFQNSNMSMYCGRFASLYVAQRPWYRMALIAMATALDRNNAIDGTLLLAFDALERSCSVRDSMGGPMDNTYFDRLYTRLSSVGWYDENVTLQCQQLALLMQTQDFDAPYMPLYFFLYKTWYFQYFSHFILYNAGDMRTGAIAFSVFLALSLAFFVLFVLVVPVWMTSVYCYRAYEKRRLVSKMFSYSNELL